MNSVGVSWEKELLALQDGLVECFPRNRDMQPLVTIGMSVLNCEETLHQAMFSILRQTYDNWELLVLDDGSTDNTLKFALSFNDARVRVMSDGQNMGLPARLNQAVTMGQGKYFARMDGDDIAYPERLERQVNYLERYPNVDLAGSRVIIFEGNGEVVGSYPYKKTHAEICRRPWASFYLPHPTWLGKIEWFRANPYRKEFKKTQDQELLLRTYKYSRFACMSDFLLGYRKVTLSLKTILGGRYLYCLALFRKALVEKDPYLAIGIPEHALKSLVEMFAITTGLNYKILQHRAMPVDKRELDRWKEVWAWCNNLDSNEQRE
jgi:glycosyltransferase involved in cell wall biosynthesis